MSDFLSTVVGALVDGDGELTASDIVADAIRLATGGAAHSKDGVPSASAAHSEDGVYFTGEVHSVS